MCARQQPAPGLAIISPVVPTLYGDADPALAPDLEASMTPHAYAAFETKAPAPAWADSGFAGRRGYIRTLDDACNPSFLQDMWIKKSGVEWEMVDFQTSHGPFISQPQKVAETAVRFAEKFMALGN